MMMMMMNATFLTLLRTEKNIRVSVSVTDTPGSLSSAKSAKDNELISYWWVVRRCYNHLDCSSSLFPRYIYFLPTVRNQNEGSSKDTRGTRRQRYYVPMKQLRENDGGYIYQLNLFNRQNKVFTSLVLFMKVMPLLLNTMQCFHFSWISRRIRNCRRYMW